MTFRVIDRPWMVSIPEPRGLVWSVGHRSIWASDLRTLFIVLAAPAPPFSPAVDFADPPPRSG